MTAKGSVEKKISDREFQGAWRQDELIGGALTVVKSGITIGQRVVARKLRR
jgi:hypothetical protein